MKKYFILLMLCAGQATQAAIIQPGDLLISEIMANPSKVSDSRGEWFELFNASANTINLNGLTISDNAGNTHTINNGGSLFIAAGEYLALGRSGDTRSNGGYKADYVYTNFSLANSRDQIIISKNGLTITRIEYNGLPFGKAGVSAELVSQNPPVVQSSYRLSRNNTYGDGDTGTPGARGSFELTHAAIVPVPAGIWLFGSIMLLGLKAVNMQSNGRPGLFNRR